MLATKLPEKRPQPLNEYITLPVTAGMKDCLFSLRADHDVDVLEFMRQTLERELVRLSPEFEQKLRGGRA